MDRRGCNWTETPPQYLHAPACLKRSMARAARRRAPRANAADALERLAYAAVGLWDEKRHSQCPRPASPFRDNLVTILCAIERQSQGRIQVLKNDCKACRTVERGFFYSDRDAAIGGERQ